MHSERPKLHGVLAVLIAIGLAFLNAIRFNRYVSLLTVRQIIDLLQNSIVQPCIYNMLLYSSEIVCASELTNKYFLNEGSFKSSAFIIEVL